MHLKISENFCKSVRSCLLITLIKCLKGHKSLGSLFVCQLVKSLVSQWVTQWVTRSPIELLWTAKKTPCTFLNGVLFRPPGSLATPSRLTSPRARWAPRMRRQWWRRRRRRWWGLWTTCSQGTLSVKLLSDSDSFLNFSRRWWTPWTMWGPSDPSATPVPIRSTPVTRMWFLTGIVFLRLSNKYWNVSGNFVAESHFNVLTYFSIYMWTARVSIRESVGIILSFRPVPPVNLRIVFELKSLLGLCYPQNATVMMKTNQNIDLKTNQNINLKSFTCL